MQPKWLHMATRLYSAVKVVQRAGALLTQLCLYVDANTKHSQHAKSKWCLQADSGALQDATREDLAKVLGE